MATEGKPASNRPGHQCVCETRRDHDSAAHGGAREQRAPARRCGELQLEVEVEELAGGRVQLRGRGTRAEEEGPGRDAAAQQPQQ